MKCKHHIIPKSRFDVKTNLDINSEANIKILSDKQHKALHSLFGTKHPREQLFQLFEINKTVLSPKAKTLLIELFTMEDNEFYK